MKERPILFSSEMVRAILEGRKTQTRRVVKKIPCQCSEWMPHEISKTTPEGYQEAGHSGLWSCQCCTDTPRECPYGKPGDRLWVRETWLPDPPQTDIEFDYCLYSDGENHNFDALPKKYKNPKHIIYKASWDDTPLRWIPSIFMPRWASRITLEIVNIRVEKVQEIGEEDAWSEGVGGGVMGRFDIDGRVLFKDLWDSINAKKGLVFEDEFGTISSSGIYSWVFNPWVWVIEFKRVTE